MITKNTKDEAIIRLCRMYRLVDFTNVGNKAWLCNKIKELAIKKQVTYNKGKGERYE